MADVYREKVGGLCLALESEESRAGAREAIRELIEAIVLEPDGERLRITLKGDLAGMLSAARDSKRSPDTHPETAAPLFVVPGVPRTDCGRAISLAGGQTTESNHTLLDRGMGRQIPVQTEGVRTPIELAQALKYANRAGRVEPRGAHEQYAKLVGFELFILRVGALQPLETNLANPGREHPSGRRHKPNRTDDLLLEQPLDGVAADNMRHLVCKDKGDVILVPVAQLHERSRDEDEPARQRKGRRAISLDGGHLEAVKSIPNHRRELRGNLVQQRLVGPIRIARGFLEHDRGHVASDGVLGLNAFRLASGDGLPHPLGLANLDPRDLAKLVEHASSHGTSVQAAEIFERSWRSKLACSFKPDYVQLTACHAPSEPFHAASAHYASEADVAHSASRVRLSVVAGGVMLLAVSRGAEAQDARPPAAVETWAGYATVEDSGNHALVGAGMRFYVSPRLSLSPRVRYARTFGDTPDEHTDLYLETALTFEFRRPANGRPRIVSPFLLVSGGVWVQRFQETRFSREWTRTEPAWGVMVGARLFLPFARGRMYVAPEVGYAALMTVAAPVTLGLALRGQDDRATGAQ